MPKRPHAWVHTPERHPLLRTSGLGSPSSPLTPRTYNSTPRASPLGMGGSRLPQRLNAYGARAYRRAIRGFQRMHAARGGMRTLYSTARRRLFGTPLAGARTAATLSAPEAFLVQYAYFTALNWLLMKMGAHRFIAHHTTVEDFRLRSEPMETDLVNNMFGDGDPIAVCSPGFPNVMTGLEMYAAPIAAPA